jgi:hypothetical protein
MLRNLLLGVASLLVLGCGGSSNTGALPTGAGEAISDTHALLLDVTYGGGTLKSAKDLDTFESRFPKAVAAIKSGEVKVLWGKVIKDNSPSPEIIAYESKASEQGGWVIKDNGKLSQLSAADFSSQVPAKK